MGGDAPLVRERLRELSGPELYRRNAFRVTGSSTCASRRTLVRRRQQIATAAKAGVAVGAAGAGPEELRTAFDVLDHPQRRIVDELFWLWDAPDASCPCEPELHRQHDEAVRAHARALDGELRDPGVPQRPAGGKKGPAGGKKRPAGGKKHGPNRVAGESPEEHWQSAARLWRKLLGQRGVWAHLRHRVAALDDKRLTEAAVTVLEAEVRRVLVSAVAGLAARTEDPARLARYCAQWTWTGSGLLGEALEEQLTPLYESAAGELRAAGEKLAGTFPDGGGKTVATAVAGTLRARVIPVVERLGAFAGFGMSLTVGQLSDGTALLLNNCAVALSPASDTAPPDRESFVLLDLALRLKPYEETRRTIEQNRARLDEAGVWFTKAKPAFDPVVAALEKASRQLDRKDARGAAATLEAALPSLHELRRLSRGAFAALPDVRQAVDRLCDSAAILLNNCALGLGSYEGGRGLRLLELAEELCTTEESRVRIAANRLLIDHARQSGYRFGTPYAVRRQPRKSVRTHLAEIYYGESPLAAKVWTSVVVLLILGAVVFLFD
ncbi:hypothetical protein [Streptomyces lomondensis]|uniref:Uncharacterized protein n=1 Tax=Streptomyces lomondensis TaxID=68229 RepID=A0ABQ2XAL4_9ACTN|nr:hypothetical protein [Streptomyces lomondensis]MCF0077064.1 hypothetical protein [Streptomyces lomondensis]GGX06996.1 hypothetical protein GCM10010383_41330 [Streptomyces lomondensis]